MLGNPGVDSFRLWSGSIHNTQHASAQSHLYAGVHAIHTGGYLYPGTYRSDACDRTHAYTYSDGNGNTRSGRLDARTDTSGGI